MLMETIICCQLSTDNRKFRTVLETESISDENQNQTCKFDDDFTFLEFKP